MTDFVLVRHATTAWSGHRYCGRSDPWLSAAGREEAERVAAVLADSLSSGVRIVSSPRRRARQTARAIAAGLGGVAIEIDDRWAETDFGDAEGRTFDDLSRRRPELAARLANGTIPIDFPGGEAAAELLARVGSAWRSIVATDRPAVIVTHAGPLRIALALADGIAIDDVALPPTGAIVRRSIPGRSGRPVLPSGS